MATIQEDEELWKTLNSKIWAYKTPEPVVPAVNDSDNDDDLPELNIDASDEEIDTIDSPYEETATVCSECNTNFDTPEELEQHEEIHSAESNYICEECGEGFGMKKTLNSHLTVHKVEKKFECDTCHKKFNYRENLLFHMRIHIKNQTFNCDICNKKFASKELLDSHVAKHVVSIKDKNNPNRVLLLPVVKPKLGEGSAATLPVTEVFACDMCNKKYTDKVSLENHKIVHIKHVRGPSLLVRKKAKPIQANIIHSCHKCDEKFKDRPLLMVHLANCPNMKFYKCLKCGGRFHHKATFRTHVAKCNESIIKPGQVPCSFCKKLYQVPVDPKQDGSQPMKFICEPCCAQLAQKSQVSGFTPRLENRFICNKCEKCFASEESLRKHMKSHAADCYYACRNCDDKKYFLTKRALQAHLASHNTSKKQLSNYSRVSNNSLVMAEKETPVQASKELNGRAAEVISNNLPTQNYTRSPDKRPCSPKRPNKRPRLVGNEVEQKEIVQVKSEPVVDVDKSSHTGGSGGRRAHLYYSEDTSDASVNGKFSLVRGNSSDEESDDDDDFEDEDMLELDVFIKNEVESDDDDSEDSSDSQSCTIFNPVRSKDTMGVSWNIPDKIIKQERNVIKQDPVSVDVTTIKKEQLDDDEELTIKDEIDIFNKQIKDERSSYQESFEFTHLGYIAVKNEPDN